MTVLEFQKTRRGIGAHLSRLLRRMARGAVPTRAGARTPDGLRPTQKPRPARPEREGEDGPMPKTARVYVAAVACLAAAVAAAVLPESHWGKVSVLLFCALLVLQAVIVLTADFPRFAESPAVPTSVAVQLAGVVLLTPGPAAAAVALGALTMFLRPRTPRDRSVFVVSGVFLTPAAGGAVYCALHGSRSLQSPDMPQMLLPILLSALTLSTVPAAMVGVLSVIGGRLNPRAAVREAVRHMIPRNVAYSFVGFLAAVLWQNHAQVMATLVVLGPLLVTRWATNQYAAQRAAHDATVRALVQAVEIKDRYTRGHSERVAKVSELIAHRLGLEEDRVSILSYAAILHDVGKLGVPTRLLQKDGRLDPMELAAIRVHPARGVEVVRDIAFLDEAYTAILHHHERMDGRGYPTGLAGDEIPEFARIIAVADAFDSMTSTRSYRPARPVPEAVVELRNCAGSQFDPVMVDAIEEALDEIERAGRPWTGDGTISVASVGAGPFADDALREPVPAQAPCPLGAAADDFDHDDPAFSVAAPLPEQLGPRNGSNGANVGHGANGTNGSNGNGSAAVKSVTGTPLPRRMTRREPR
jgi:hypothetical protein